MNRFKKVTTKENLIDWLVYSIITIFLLIPFFTYDEYHKHISISILIGFLFGMLNRIIRELVLLREQQYEKDK